MIEYTPTSSAGAAVRLDNLELGFHGKTAAKVTLDIEPGEVVVFLGPSGCGKSTILRALAGLLPPMSGTATVDGDTIFGNDRHCAMVFQEDALLPWRTALKNVEFPLRLRGSRGKAAKAAATTYLEQVGLARTSTIFPVTCPAVCVSACSLPEHSHAHPASCSWTSLRRARRTDPTRHAEIADRSVDTNANDHPVRHSRLDEALLLADRVVLLTHRPATVADVIEIERPRDASAQLDVQYQRRRQEILKFLGHAPLNS